MNAITPDFWLFFGRLHPLLVHLPIGFLVLLVCLEILACLPSCRNLRAARGAVLALAVPACALSAWCGWLLAGGGGYDPVLLERHWWAGLGVAVTCLLALVLHWLDWRTGYGVVLALLFCGLLVAGHFGGSLTHGHDYLTRYLPAVWRPFGAGDPAAAPGEGGPNKGGTSAFATLVEPVLDAKCVACHGPAKTKAGLRLDTLEGVLKGGKNGPVVKPGNSAESKLIKRLSLPLEDDDHMPPAGKPQPTPEELALVQWWIDAGAPGD